MVCAVEMELVNAMIRLELKDGEKIKKLVKERKKIANKGTLEDSEMEPVVISRLKSSMMQT